MEIDKLFALIDQVRAKMDKKSPGSLQQPARLDLRRCTWDQVMGEVHSAATRWSTTPKKSSKIMNCLDKLGQNSAAFKSWLELLPAGDYGSRYPTLCLSGTGQEKMHAEGCSASVVFSQLRLG